MLKFFVTLFFDIASAIQLSIFNQSVTFINHVK